ncbi:MAG: hypothetical protein ABIH76_07135 [Candidatus Bathyarchaeota archaeon]
MKSRTGYLTQDARSEGEKVKLSYAEHRETGQTERYILFPTEKCPPVDQLKKGTKIHIFYQNSGTVERIEIAR